MNQEIKSVNNPSMVKALIRKDWYFNKQNFLLFFILGLASVALLSFDNSAFYIGLVLLLSVVILIGALLIFSTLTQDVAMKQLRHLWSLKSLPQVYSPYLP